VIIATIVEFEQRMLTNRPTVARTSVWLIWLAARRPTRAREPRTEITRPKDAVAAAIDMSEIRVAAPFCFARLCMALLEKLLSPRTSKTVKTAAFLPATRCPAIAGLFSPGLIGKWAFQAACRYGNRSELNPSFTNVAGEVGPIEGARFQNRPGGDAAGRAGNKPCGLTNRVFLGGGWNKAALSRFDTTGSNLGEAALLLGRFSHLI
jgi:hypothetical protein